MALQSFILCMVVFAVSAATVPLLEGKEQHTQLVPRTLDIEPGDEDPQDSIQVSVARVVTKTLLALGAAQVVYVLVDDYILMPLGIDLNIRRKKRESNEGWIFEDEILRHVIDSIDPVNMLFKYMAIDDEACRQKAVCKASSISLIAKSIRNMSPYVRGLEKYKDAVDVGEALEDCSLLFAECQDY